MSDARSKRATALFVAVAIAGLVVVVAQRLSNEEAEIADVGWYGEQWDVARRCVVGTPLGRGEGQERLADRVIVEALRAAAAIEAGEDPERTWPWRCMGRLASLRSPPALSESPVEALAALELSLGRVLVAPFSIAGIEDGADAVARAVARLDRVMPPGGEYDRARFAQAALAAPVDSILRSHAADTWPVIPPRRPFLRARVGDERLHDERIVDGVSERLVGDADAPRLTRSSGEERRLSAEGVRLPRFFDRGRLAWITDADRASVVLEALATGARGEPRVFGAPRPDRWAASPEAVLLGVDEAVWLARWDAPLDAIPLEPPPPDEGAVWASDGRTTALAWPTPAGWVGHRCAATCRPLPPLRAGGDLQIAVHDGHVFALARSATHPLTYGHRLAADAHEWAPPVVMPRGALEGGAHRFTLSVLGAALWSDAGERWAEPVE